MKKVKLSELREGDLFVYNSCYYEATGAPTEEFGSIEYSKARCFMSPLRSKRIGMMIYIPSKVEVMLCEREL